MQLNLPIPTLQKTELMHLKAIISEDLAKSGKIGEYIAPIIDTEKRRNTIVIVCKGEAKNLSKSEPSLAS